MPARAWKDREAETLADELQRTISAVVRVMLTMNNQSREELAEVCGVGPQAIADRFAGRVRWSVDDLACLAQHWHLRAADFLRHPQALIDHPHRRVM